MKYIARKIKNRLKADNARLLIQNMSHMIFENILKLFLGFFVSVWIARALGPSDYGHFSYVISFCMIFAPFYTMGVDDISVKNFVESPSRHSEIIGSSALIKFVGGLFGILLSNLCIFLINPSETLIKWGVFAYSLSQLIKVFDVISIWYLAEIKIKKVAISRNIILIISSGIKVYFLFLKGSWFEFVLISCLDLVLIAFAYIILYYLERKSIFDWRSTLKNFKSYLFASLPLFVITLFSMAIGKIDQIMVGEMLGPEQLGKYAVAVRLVDLWHFIPLAIISTLFPKYIQKRSDKEGQKEIRALMIFSMLLTGITFAICVSLISSFLVGRLYGSQYMDSSVFLAYYSWLAVFVFVTYARGKIFLVENNIKDGAILAFANLLFNIGLNFIFIPKWGVKGAIWASILSYILSDIILSIINVNIRRNFFYVFESIYFTKSFIKRF